MRPKPWEKTSIYSLIVPLDQTISLLGVTASLNLGTVINRLDKEWICIGSGEKLGTEDTFKVEEIRCYIVREGALQTVREIYETWIQRNEPLKSGKEVVIKGTLDTSDPDSPLIQTENSDTIISLLYNNADVKVRFIKENLKYIEGIDLTQITSYRGTEIYIFGQATQIAPQQWEILGRALLPTESK